MGLFGGDAKIDSHASAAWANLRTHASSRDGSGSGASTPRRGTPHEYDADYNAAIQRLNATRTAQGHIAAPGTHKLPHTERMPQRRMMLAVCGENYTYDTMAEVHRYVCSQNEMRADNADWWTTSSGPRLRAGPSLLARRGRLSPSLCALTVRLSWGE